MITTDTDYSYIGIFIKYLKDIIDIIKDLFAGLLNGKKEEETTAAE